MNTHTLKNSLVAVAMAAAMLVGVNANATVVTFDNLKSGTVSNGYAGFNWDSNIYAYDQASYRSYGNTTLFPSASMATYNGSGVRSVSVSGVSGSLFDLNGAYFTGWASGNKAASYTATSVTLTGFLAGVDMGSVTSQLSPSAFTWVGTNFGAIDSFTITSSNTSQWWLMDNLTVNAARNDVPEPSSMALLGLGLVAMAALRRRKSA